MGILVVVPWVPSIGFVVVDSEHEIVVVVLADLDTAVVVGKKLLDVSFLTTMITN